MEKKVLVCVAHDDDALLGVGGRMVRHVREGDEVHVVIGGDGRRSHQANFGTTANPSMQEVAAARKEEILWALADLGVLEHNVHFLKLTKGNGAVRENVDEAAAQVSDFMSGVTPDIVYTHHPDAHPDHVAMSNVVRMVLQVWPRKIAVFLFFIWTRELAQGRTDANLGDIPNMPADIIKVCLNEFEQATKRSALFEMTSQVQSWPYDDWQVQPRPVLDQAFLNYFLRGEELLVQVLWN